MAKLIFFTLMATVGLVSGTKMVVTYLGTDFILPGGCPPPPCDENLRDCRRQQIDMKTKFDDCMVDKATKQGCMTDKLPDGKLFTIPLLANFCSKFCLPDDKLASIHECPYEGFIHQSVDPELERRF